MAALAVAFLNVQIPLRLGDVINVIAELIKQNDKNFSLAQNLKVPMFKLVILYILQAFGTFVYISVLSSVGEVLAAKMKFKLYSSLIKQDVAFFDTIRSGVIIDCLTSDVQEFKSAFKLCISQGLRSITQIAGCIVSLYIISPKMTLAIVGVVPVIISVGTACGSLLRSMSKKAQKEAMKVASMFEETLTTIRTIKAFANEEFECRKLKVLLTEISHLNSLLGYGIGLFQGATNLFLNGLVLGTLCFGGHLMLQQNLTPGNLMSFLVATQTIQKSFSQISLLFGHIVKGKEAGERVFKFCNIVPTIPCKGGIKINYYSLNPTVEFKDVTFSYPTREKQVILNRLNLYIPAGKTVAVVGTSGNGKSTIAALLERFYDVNSGQVLVAGVDIKKLDPNWLRGELIGIINQEPVLFATTIKENIRYGKPDATDEEVYEAARLANADEFINEFPDGFNTVLGERGVTISGGQKQRIAIARALIKNPSILILDEATSALDSESEKIVQSTLENVCKGKTVLIIAHRLTTVQNADMIVVLKKGKIIEAGTHMELMTKEGMYFKLMQSTKQTDGKSL
ncbi:ATP-binding cassette sub-family B member 8, mitochondrial isoform X2 [Cimex lectularius]|uniref:Mitochondrial potassium channel ATP-binding subunit n=1 Tax=Cimex lectularius TaxID=79782 RepID=A0A8I6SEF5_CIMLE|nr:ATP-binding cassette sub-family B member 8, mitochondrial isoform X2 [Cimex lectularius]